MNSRPPARERAKGLISEREERPPLVRVVKQPKKARPLPDFFTGAHAYVANLPLLTRDPRRVRTFFPSVRLITP